MDLDQMSSLPHPRSRPPCLMRICFIMKPCDESVADSVLELTGKGAGFVFLALPVFLPSVFLSFLPKIKREGRGGFLL